jgi:UDP-2,3-diacylglucosamine hydrolase
MNNMSQDERAINEALTEAEAIFVADVHWQPFDNLGAFGRFLTELSFNITTNKRTVTLYILGDLFDFWFERRQRYFKCYQAHIEALARAKAAGVRLVLLSGNRDFTYGQAITQATGAELAGDWCAPEQGGGQILLHHGDLFCTDDKPYQRYRRLIRSAPSRLLMNLIPWCLVESAIGRLRHTSRAAIKQKAPESMGIVDTAVAAQLARGYKLVVCGHVHKPIRRSVIGVPADGQLLVLGPWDDKEGHFAILQRNGQCLDIIYR